MIITLTLDKINIPIDSIYCTFSNETLEKLYGSTKRRPKRNYKIFLNKRELQIQCPVIKNAKQPDALVIWPAIKLPHRKYPIHIYLYAVALYLSSGLSMRKAAAKVRGILGLEKFSHSTLSRTLQKLTENAPELITVMTADTHQYNNGTSPVELVVRKTWDKSKQDQYCLLLKILHPVLNKSRLIEYAALLNYDYYKKHKKFML